MVDAALRCSASRCSRGCMLALPLLPPSASSAHVLCLAAVPPNTPTPAHTCSQRHDFHHHHHHRHHPADVPLEREAAHRRLLRAARQEGAGRRGGLHGGDQGQAARARGRAARVEERERERGAPPPSPYKLCVPTRLFCLSRVPPPHCACVAGPFAPLSVRAPATPPEFPGHVSPSF